MNGYYNSSNVPNLHASHSLYVYSLHVTNSEYCIVLAYKGMMCIAAVHVSTCMLYINNIFIRVCTSIY